MPRLENDNEYQKTIKELKNLRKIGAHSNFETELLRKINAGSQRKEKKSWFDLVFSPMLIPTTALTFTTMIIFLSAMIIFLILRPQVDETGKNLRVSPQLFEEKIDKPSDFRQETQKGRTSTTDRPKINGTFPEVISNEAKKEGKSDQKTITVGGQNFNVLRTNEKDSKPIEMLKEKIDTTKDSSKYR